MRDGRLRIAFVVHDYTRRLGHSRYVVELATRYRHDHEVHVFTNTVDPTEAAGITFHHVAAWRPNAFASILSFVAPATWAVGNGFDIVHAQGLCGLRHNVATMHFCQPAWYDALATATGPLNWRQRLTRAIVTPLERYALVKPSTRRVIGISEQTRGDLSRYYRRTAGVRVVYHGIDLDSFHPRNQALHRDAVRAEFGVPPEAFLALFVGNLQKGAAAAIRAVARVPGIQLALVSSSDTTSDRAIAVAEGVANLVRFLPARSDVHRCFAAADAFVFPTLYEPYGMVISEAMATGLPVITSRAAGAAELITHGVDGWLTDSPWDVPAIASGLSLLASNGHLREQMGAAARTRVEDFTWDRVAEETMAVYREVVAERAG